jgi:hypothetical protein
MAEIAYSQGRSAPATQVFGLATLLRETHHIPRPSGHAKLCATRIDELHAMLGEEAYLRAWAQGQKLSLEEAIQLMGTLLSAPETMTASPNATDQPGRNG